MKHCYYQFCISFLSFCIVPVLLIGQTDGTPDSTFGQAGEVIIQDSDKTYYGGHTVLLPDGKMIVAGNEYEELGDDGIPVLTRLMPDGSLDTSYGINGQVRPEIGSSGAEIGKIALTADGKLLVLGEILNSFFQRAFVARLDADGQLDASFGPDGSGIIVVSIPSSDTNLSAVIIKPDGHILLGGSLYNHLGGPGIYDFMVMQLSPDGILDTSFGTNGIATADFAAGLEEVLSLALQADGNIIAAGANATANYNVEIVRFHPNGTIDQSFANGGMLVFDLGMRDDVVYAVAVQNDQKIVCCGVSFQSTSAGIGQIMLFRLDTNGTFDSTFGSGGYVFTDLGFLEFARSIVLQPDGKILIGAENIESGTIGEKGQSWVLRYNTDGSPDNSFGQEGRVQTPLYDPSPESAEILLQPDGKIIHASTAGNHLVLWRYLNDIMVGTTEKQLTDFQFQCSPNPVSDEVKMSWLLKESSQVRCDLYDAQGQLLETIIPPSFLQAGVQHQNVHFGNNIPVGACFLVLRVNNEQQVMKLIKG